MRHAPFLCAYLVRHDFYSLKMQNVVLVFLKGQLIVARLREQTYTATLRQEVEFVERGEGDALSRLSIDSTPS